MGLRPTPMKMICPLYHIQSWESVRVRVTGTLQAPSRIFIGGDSIAAQFALQRS
jgi:hypothetical protein